MYEGALGAVGSLRGKRVLDAGCGSGLALRLASEAGAEVSGVDATPELVAIARERVAGGDVRVGDIESLPFGDREFDAVFAFNAIQYAENPMNALRELRRVAKPDGMVVIGQWGDVTRCETESLFKALRALAQPPPGNSGAARALRGRVPRGAARRRRVAPRAVGRGYDGVRVSRPRHRVARDRIVRPNRTRRLGRR